MKITRHYSRKVQEQNMGGNRYESSDYGIWIEEEFEIPGTLKREEFIQEKSAYLDALCRAEVGKSIGTRRLEIEEGSNSERESEPFTSNKKI